MHRQQVPLKYIGFRIVHLIAKYVTVPIVSRSWATVDLHQWFDLHLWCESLVKVFMWFLGTNDARTGNLANILTIYQITKQPNNLTHNSKYSLQSYDREQKIIRSILLMFYKNCTVLIFIFELFFYYVFMFLL